MDIIGTLNALNNIQKLASKVEDAAKIKEYVDALAQDVKNLTASMSAVQARLKELQGVLLEMVKGGANG